MNNTERIITEAKKHRAGASTHKFNTEFGWKKAGFCARPGAQAKFSARLCYKTPKGFIWKDEPIFRDDQVCTPEEAKMWREAFAPKQASTPKREAKPAPVTSAKKVEPFCKSATLRGNTYLIYDESVYAKICKALDKAREYKASYAKATEERKRTYFKAEVEWYCNRAYEVANAYANA